MGVRAVQKARILSGLSWERVQAALGVAPSFPDLVRVWLRT